MATRRGSDSGQNAMMLMAGREIENRDVAAKTFQRYWSARLAHKADKNGMSSKRAKDMIFADLSRELREVPRIRTMKLILHRVVVLTSHGVRVCPGSEATKFVNVRVFLAAYMIAFHPGKVFEAINALETELIHRSRKMLVVFDRLCAALMSVKNQTDMCNGVAASIEFPGVLHYYLKAFQAWKIPDEAKLAARITHAIIALLQAENHLVNEDSTCQSMRKNFSSSRNRLCAKLVQVGGQKALATLNAKIAASDQHLTLVSEDPGVYPVRTDVVLTNEAGYSALPRRMTNEQLAHELQLDPTFAFDEHGGCSTEDPVHSKIRKSFHEAFWASLEDDLRLDPPNYVRIRRVIMEIHDGITMIQNGAGKFKDTTRIQEVIDIDFIQGQVKEEAFEWTAIMKLVTDIESVLKECHSPLTTPPTLNGACKKSGFKRKLIESASETARSTDSAWKAVAQMLGLAFSDIEARPNAFCTALRFLLDHVRNVHIEMANSRLRLVGPVLYDHGVDYEIAHFEKKRKLGLELTNVRKLVRQVIREDVVANRVKLTDLTTNDAAKATSFKGIVESTMASLVVESTTRITATSCPETFILDLDRLRNAQFSFSHYVTTASILVTVAFKLRDIGQVNPTALIHGITARLSGMGPGKGRIRAMIETVREELTNFSSMDDDTRNVLCDVLSKGVTQERPVPRLMRSRFREVFLLGVRGEEHHLKDPQTTAEVFNELKLPRVAYEVGVYVFNMGLKLRKCMTHNALVHAAVYNDLISEEALAEALTVVYEKVVPEVLVTSK